MSAENLRCLIVTTHYCPLVGGAQTVYDALARCRPTQFQILTSRRDYLTGTLVDGYVGFDTAAPYKITRLDRVRPDLAVGHSSALVRGFSALKWWWLNRQMVSQIKMICRTEEIDVVCIGAGEAFMWLPPVLKRCMDQKIMIFTHGEEISQVAHSKKAEQNRRHALAAADGVIAVSNYTTRLLVEKYSVPEDKILLCTNGVDLEKFSGVVAESAREKLRFPKGPTVFSCGRLVARKGFDQLIEAWPDVVSEIQDATLLIGGTGPMEAQLKERVEALGLTESVWFLGEIKPEDMSAYYGLSSVFAMPNRTLPDGDTEGFGLVFLEASAMATPSIAGCAGGTADAVLEDETGLRIDGTDGQEIAKALINLLTDDELRGAMSQAALKFARGQGWSNKVSGIIDFMAAAKAKHY